MVSMLLRRDGGTYVLRRVIPAALRSIVGKRELRISLRTKNVEEAKQRMKVEGIKVDRILDAARAKHKLLAENPAKLVESWKRKALASDLESRRDAPRRDEDAVDEELEVLDSAIADTRQAIAENDTGAISALVAAVLAEHGLTGLPPEATRKLARGLLEARLDALRIARKRAAGDNSAELPAEPEATQGDVLVSEALTAYMTERRLPSKTAHEVKATFTRFLASCGGDRPIREVGKGEVRRFREHLLSGSAKTGKGKGSLAPATVKKYLNLLGTVFQHAVRTGLLDSSPVAGMAFVARGGQEQDRERKRQPFSADHLQTLFGSAVYHKGTPRDALWWTFPLGLYSGMRIEEAMGLRAEDVREIEGVRCFVVEPRPDRPLKTASSRRVVPVHDALIRLGLIRERVEGKTGLLFPELRRDARHGTYTAALSKKAGRLLRSLGLPPTITTHSTRHSFADALRDAKVEPEVRARLLGHSLGTITEKYGRGHDVRALQEAVNAVRYAGVSLALTGIGGPVRAT